MGKKITPKKLEMSGRRERVAELYLRQKTQMEIAAELDVDQATVSRDLKELQRIWRESAVMALDEVKARELAKIDALEREYWDAWELSKSAKENTLTEKVDDGDGTRFKAQVSKTAQTGDARYLSGVQWCIERRCKLLGLDAAQKVDAITRNLDLTKLSDEQLTRLANGDDPIAVLLSQ
jgi:arginine repressor